MSENYRRRRRRPAPRRRKKRWGLVLALLCTLAIILFSGGWLVGKLLSREKKEYYPVKYQDTIRACAQEFDLPPAYVAAVILAESSYNPDAVSSADARGLMQLLPSTAEWVASKVGDSYEEERLFEPETNIRYGCWYLSFLMKRYDGNMQYSSAAYHAGQGTVDNWLKEAAQQAENGEAQQVIASSVTNTYVSRVLKNYEEYSKLYSTES